MKLLVGRDPRFAQTALNALFSLGFAVLIWAAVGARITETNRFKVPFEIRVPSELAVEYRDPPAPPGQHPTIEILVRGPHEVISKLDPNEIRGYREFVPSDEASVDRGLEQEIAIDTDSFTRAKGIEVIGTNPGRLRVVVSRMDTRSFAVKAETRGNPAPGYRVNPEIQYDPPEIVVSGARARLVARQEPFVLWPPCDLSGLRKDFVGYRRAQPVDGLVPENRDVRVVIKVEPEPVEREYDFPVRLLTLPGVLSPNVAFEPPPREWKVKVAVKGSLDALNAFERSRLPIKDGDDEPAAFVRLTQAPLIGPNEYLVEVVNLPSELAYAKAKLRVVAKEVKNP